MFRLLEMLFSTARTAQRETLDQPWTCPECGQAFPPMESRRHRITHKVTTVSKDPLVVELRCWDRENDLGPALAELKRRWPGRKFQLMPGAYAEGFEGGGHKLRSLVAIEDDWTIPHDPFGPV
jgi:hypothetical protein